MSDLPAPHFLHRASPPHIMTLVLLTGLAALSMNIFLPSLPGMAAWFGVPGWWRPLRLWTPPAPLYSRRAS